MLKLHSSPSRIGNKIMGTRGEYLFLCAYSACDVAGFSWRLSFYVKA